MMTFRNSKRRFLLLALASLAFGAGSSPAANAPHGAPNTVAVIYDARDDMGAADLYGIINGIEETPDVVVYRIALKTVEHEQAAVPARPLQLAYNSQGGIAVIYPDIGEPYRSVFSQIIEGIEGKAKMRVASYPVGANQSAQELAAELRQQNVQIVIVLGRNGLKAASGLDRSIGIVLGGVLSVPESETRGMSVHSLAPDPALLFERLKGLMPSVRRVFVVYDPRSNAWLIQLAREAARNQGLELVAQEATDLKTAMRFYQENMVAADPKRDALWLPQDMATVDESAVLPFVLQEAWSRSLVVFSSNVAHVKRGALFSLYPNNIELGRNLAGAALARLSPGGQGGRAIAPLREVLMAVNVRTAEHLGLGLGQRQRQTFDRVFPEQ